MSGRQKEFASRLAVINCRRSLILAMALVIILPITALLENMAGNGGVRLWAAFIVAETVQTAAALILIYTVKRNEQDYMPAVYKIYLAATVITLLALSVVEYKQSGSLLFLICTMGIYVFVPVLPRREQGISVYAMLVCAVLYCVLSISLGTRAVVDVAIVFVASILLGRSNFERGRYQQKTKDELKEKNSYSAQDTLTGMTNSRGLEKKVSLLWSYCVKAHVMVGAIVIDIDYLRKYNDKYGHMQGDRCLKLVAETIKDCAMQGSDVTARTDSGEFMVFVQNMSREEIIELALEIRARIAKLKIPQAYVGVSQYVTVSMGVACTYPDANNSFGKLCSQAQQALLTAKDNGRNCIVCDNQIYGRMKNGLGTVISG